MPNPSIVSGALSIAAVQPEHIERIRQWRNAQMDVLRQMSAISPEQQQAYYAEQVWPAMAAARPRNILLAYRERDRLIGYGGLVHIAWEHLRAEISFLLDADLAGNHDAYPEYFSSFLRLIKILAFRDLHLNRLFTETYAKRSTHIRILETCGFRREGTLREHVRVGRQAVDSIIHGCLRSDWEDQSE